MARPKKIKLIPCCECKYWTTEQKGNLWGLCHNKKYYVYHSQGNYSAPNETYCQTSCPLGERADPIDNLVN